MELYGALGGSLGREVLVAGASGRFFFNIIMNHVNGNTACLF